VTFDFGDGRRIVRTTTGNSAHYVLDETGMVLDVLPGLYAPSVFKTELEAAEELFDDVTGETRDDRLAKVRAHHKQLLTVRAERTINTTLPYVPGRQSLFALGEREKVSMIAQRATVSKAMVETRDFVATGIATVESSRDDRAAWAAIGQEMWRMKGTSEAPPQILDAQSRALVLTLQSAVPPGMKQPTAAEKTGVVTRFEQSIVADTAINDLVLRPQISAFIEGTGTVDFETLNTWVYATVFFTPKSDPWLNLLPRDEFTGLPGDGVLMQ
jgi:hypothetical protein